MIQEYLIKTFNNAARLNYDNLEVKSNSVYNKQEFSFKSAILQTIARYILKSLRDNNLNICLNKSQFNSYLYDIVSS